MATLISFLIFCQALGASVGAFTAVWSEIAYIRAMRDRKIDIAERKHLDIIAHGLRYGMSLLLLSSLGLVIVAYLLHVAPQPATTPGYWVGSFLALLIIGISWARSKRFVSFATASAIVFTAWWFLTYLVFGELSVPSFGSTVALFIITTAVFYALFHYVRFFSAHLAQKGN